MKTTRTKHSKKIDHHARQIGELENIVDLYGRRCKELEAIVALKDQRIQQLEKMLGQQNVVINNPTPGTPISIPTVWQVPGCQHEYPADWNSTVPPSCRKCGMPAQVYQPYWVYSNTPNFQCNQQHTLQGTFDKMTCDALTVNQVGSSVNLVDDDPIIRTFSMLARARAQSRA